MIGQNVAFDIFICKALDQLRHDVRGRSSAAQELSQACKDLTGKSARTRFTAPLPINELYAVTI
jgi:hypothetical protein